jgi:hypothetical protein
MNRDEDGHRNYKLKGLVHVDPGEGPAAALQAPGLPQPGAMWLVDLDIDIWAFCRQPANVTPASGYQEGEPIEWFEVEFTFSTKPDEKRCKDQQIEDPLLVPDRVSGSFVKYTQEARFDRNGIPITSSSHEMIRGPNVEFDSHRMTVKIEQNRSDLELPLLNSMANTVNDDTLWGVPRRCIKFIPGNWSRDFYGTCSKYYKRDLEFDIWMIVDNNPLSPTYGQMVSGHDRDITDEGNKVLNGTWDYTSPQGVWLRKAIGSGTLNPDSAGVINPAEPLNPDPNNPRHFIRYKDRRQENTSVILDGTGLPAGQMLPGGPSKWLPNKCYDVGDLVVNIGTDSNPGDGDIYECIKVPTVLGTGSNSCTPQPQPPNGTYWSNNGPPTVSQPGTIHVEYYTESDFTLLNIPLTL